MIYWIMPALIVVWYGGRLAFQSRPRRRQEAGFGYIYINDDGTARELDADEQSYSSS